MFDEKSNVEKNQEEIRILNKHQVAFYLKKGVSPVRIELGFDDRIVFVFLREDTIRTKCWEQWKAYTIERKLEKLKFCNNVENCDFDDDDYFFNE